MRGLTQRHMKNKQELCDAHLLPGPVMQVGSQGEVLSMFRISIFIQQARQHVRETYGVQTSAEEIAHLLWHSQLQQGAKGRAPILMRQSDAKPPVMIQLPQWLSPPYSHC